MNNADRKGRRFLRFVVATTLVLPCWLAAGCHRNDAEQDPAESPVSAAAPRPVELYRIPDGTQDEVRTFPVFVKGGETAKLSFRVPGRLVKFDAEIGSRFQEGDFVAQLDPRDFELAVERVKKSIAEAEAGLSAMETGARTEDVASLEAAHVAAESQLSTAKRQFERMESLHKDGAASDVQYDLAKTAYDGAIAAELSAKKNLEKAQKGSRSEEIDMVKAKIEGLKIDLQLAENKLADTTLTAPFTGVIAEKFFDNHESVLPGVAILTLVDDASYEGELSVSEEFVARQGDIKSLECTFDAIPDVVFSAKIKQTSSSLQKGNRSYLATIAIDAQPDSGLLVGMVGVAKMTLKGAADFVLIPASAIVSGESAPNAETSDSDSKNDSYVWVVSEDNKAERRSVQVGIFINDQVQILSGLDGGEQIVSAGARFLADGQSVRALEANP